MTPSRLWGWVAAFVVVVALTSFFGHGVADAVATAGAAILMAAFVWIVGSFLFGVVQGWRR